MIELLSGLVLSTDDAEPVPGYRVSALLTREVRLDPQADDTTTILAHGSGITSADGSFAFDISGEGALAGPATIRVATGDGTLVHSAEFTLDELGAPLTLRVPPPTTLAITPTDDPTRGELVTLTGRVIDAGGAVVAPALPVVLWGIAASSPDDQPQPLVVTHTQQGGYFSGPWVPTPLKSAFGRVSGSDDIPVPTVDGRLPRRVMLVMEAPVPPVVTEDGDDGSPRRPDPVDLTSSPEDYSQDLGRGCINLTTPNRVVEEFLYSTVVRTSEPDVKGLTIGSRRTVPPRFLAPLFEASAMKEVMMRGSLRGESANAFANLSLDIDTARALATDDPPPLEEIMRAAWLSDISTVKDLLSVTLSGASIRQPLDADRPIDWDDTPTVYEAVSIARGHILEYREVWRADGFSLGDLLYSLPLAPGQRRQVAIVDWERRTTTRRDEILEFEEQLDAFVARDRDVSEIVGSRLAEEVAGGSSNTTWGAAGGIGGGFIGSGFGIFGGVAGSTGGSSSTSWNEGSRRFSADALQSLRDRVMQRSSSLRDQRSTVVQTATQGETLRTETETVANYNRCHAMTVEYFEVLRHFVVSHELANVRECLFVPLPMREFTRAKTLAWQTPLTAHLRDRSLLPGFDAMRRIADDWEGWDYPLSRYSEEAPQQLEGELRMSFVLPRPRDAADGAFQIDMWNGFRPYLWMDPYELWTTHLQQGIATYNAAEVAKRDREFRQKIAPELARSIMDRLKFWYVTTDGGEREVALDATLVSRYAEGVPLYVTLRPRGALPPIPREQISHFKITLDGATLPADAQIIVHSGKVRYRTEHKQWVLFHDEHIVNDLGSTDTVYIPTPTSWQERRNPRQEDRDLEARLLAHLNANLEFHHQLIWMWLDAERRFMLLDSILVPALGGKSVASVVENRVIGIAGNSLILPVAPGLRIDPRLDAESKGNLIDLYATDVRPPLRVSVPTRGVYAEAIQGQCVACEKIDDSRYWRWTAAGMLEPPMIAEVGTGSRADVEQPLTATPLAAPLVSIQNAPDLPNPAGLADVFKVLAKPDLFTDIAGLEGTQKNARAAFDAALSAASSVATTAADLAKQNFAARDGERMLDRIAKAQKDGLLTPEAAEKLSGHVFNAMTGTPDEKAEKKAASPVKDPAVQKMLKSTTEAGKGQVKVSTPEESVEVSFDKEAEPKVGGGGSADSTSVSAFPTAYTSRLQQDTTGTLQTAFNSAVAALTSAQKSTFNRVAMTIVAVDDGASTHAAAGIRQDEVHYSGSLLKVAVMYASFELLASVQRLADVLKVKDKDDVFAKVKKAFKAPIESAVATFTSSAQFTDEHRLPKYEVMFQTTPSEKGDWLTFAFRKSYEQELEGMIPGGHNHNTRNCVHALGYSFLNGVLAAGGFFDASSKNGLWVAGDFTGGWPVARVPSVNDGDVAQAATTEKLARLMTLIYDRALVDGDKSDSMRNLLNRTGSWMHFTTPKVWELTDTAPLRVTAAKVGRGPLKAGNEVLSEGEIVHERAHGKNFVVVWQNLLGAPTHSSLTVVATVIEKTITQFLA